MISFSSYNTKKIIVLIRDNLQKKMKLVWAKSQRGGLRHSQLFSLYDLIETPKKTVKSRKNSQRKKEGIGESGISPQKN